MQPLFIKNEILINASKNIVWDVLIKPEHTQKYMFGCETVSNWKVGSELLWKGNYEGNEMIFVKGNIVEIKPNELLVYTVIDPNNPDMIDVPENYLTVTYSLSSANNETKLTVTQGDYNKVLEGEKRYKESYNNGEGWNPILIEIKKVAESI